MSGLTLEAERSRRTVELGLLLGVGLGRRLFRAGLLVAITWPDVKLFGCDAVGVLVDGCTLTEPYSKLIQTSFFKSCTSSRLPGGAVCGI